MNNNFDEIQQYLKERKTAWIQEKTKIQLIEICQKFKIQFNKEDNINEIRYKIREFLKEIYKKQDEKEQDTSTEINPFFKSSKILRSPTITPKKYNFYQSINQSLEEENTQDYTQQQSLLDIEDINDQPSLIGDKQINETTADLTTDLRNIYTDIMTAQRLPLKHIIDFVPVFDGTNISVEEYIDKLKYVKEITTEVDEPGVIAIIKGKLQKEPYKGLKNSTVRSINDFIKAVRTLYPATENLYTLYGTLMTTKQEDTETVLTFANKIRELASKIKELKQLEANTTEESLRTFYSSLNNDTKQTFRNGLKPEIKIDLREYNTLEDTITKAIEIESRINIIKHSTNQTQQKANIFTCQICENSDHEAMYCKNASCVYCKNKDHLSYYCKFARNKIELICKFCNAQGHSIDACKFNKAKGNHCQYCQTVGHTVSQCPFIIDYELCWKCKESGHDPMICTKANRQIETCEICNATDHTIRNCPSVICKNCNKLGHTIKYCPAQRTNHHQVNCAICKIEDHRTDQCDIAKILMLQNKETNQQRCQICEKKGHTANHCPEYKKTRNTSNYRNQNTYRNNNTTYGSNPTYGVTQKKCDFCKARGHILEECQKLIQLKTYKQVKKCSYCKKIGHIIDNCEEIKELINAVEKFCDYCKTTTHTTEECYRNRNHQQSFSENN